MENSTVAGLRSRSRSKTPFLRSSCDREGCTEGEEHSHKSGRKTPVKRSTPVKQLKKSSTTGKAAAEPIIEVDEVDNASPQLTHRTRKSVRTTTERLVKTSDYSSGESPDRLGGNKEITQNQQNYKYGYERVSTSKRGGSLADVNLSPIYASYNASGDRSSRFGSPAYSASSTDSSFAELALADISQLMENDPSVEHLPYRLYRSAGEYWNKYPKTDYTYSHLSRDRVELAPGQVAVPNMSRRSLAHVRLHGVPSEMQESAAYSTKAYESVKRRITSVDSSDDESWRPNGGYTPIRERWWITTLLISIITTVTTTVTSVTEAAARTAGGLYRTVAGPPRYQYPYQRTASKPGLASRAGAAAAAAVAAPFVWIYTMIKKVVTTTVTTVTETVTPSNHVGVLSAQQVERKRRRWWPWLLIPLLIALGCGSHYTYENYEHLALPNFTDFHLDLSEFANQLPKLSLSLPNFTIPELPAINITLPAIRENLPELPEVPKVYYEYRDIVHSQVTDASDYMMVVAESCFEELRRYWSGYQCIDTEQIKEMLPQSTPVEPVFADTYKAPQIVQDPNLSKRIAALEDWAINVDSQLKVFNQKLSKIDNLEAQIEQYSIKHLQNNLIQIFNVNNENGEAVAAHLKDYFDKLYVSKDQMNTMSQDIHMRLMDSVKPDMDEDRIRQIIQEYLAVFERRQMEILVARVREYVKEIRIERVETGFDVEAVKRIVAGMLEVYDADKTGLVDYAMESAGGQILSTRCTELYQIKTKQYSILGLPVWWVYTSPRYALTPGAMPAECWAFQGFPGYLVVRTFAIIEVTGFSLEHMSRLLAADGKIESAPKNFSVYGLRDENDPEPHLFGDYVYDSNGTSIQHFPVKHPKTQDIGGVSYPVAHDIVELRVESNYGNPTYTCVYRFRVHGNPLSDIKRATDDSIKDSE